ncbi:MAG: nucleotidyltransferase family protein [Deltaproteobacteria bacterium]|nr:nucleotidyltransferase family protein [Deltaproteobacteria bacterium]
MIESTSLEQIRQSGLTPWLYHWIKLQGHEDRLPVDFLQALRQDFSQHLFRSTMQQKEIREILAALAEAGIAVILLKGADLGLRVYGDPALRAMSDLDLLLAPEDIPVADLLLRRLGYQVCFEHRDKRLIINEVAYNPPQGKILFVDLHWEIVAACSFYYLPYRPLRAAAVSLDAYGMPALSLSPEHLLIHVCLHAYENFPVLSQLLDLALVVSRLPLDWQKVIQEASRFGCQLPVCLVLQEITRLVPGKIPTAALAQLGAHRPSLLEGLVLRPWLRYLTLALPYFYRHRSLRDWFQFIGANIWPHYKALETPDNRWARPIHLKNLLRKFFSKLMPES